MDEFDNGEVFSAGRIVVEETVQLRATACDYLAKRTGLSKGRVKDAMNKGALRLKKGGRGAMQRLRRATSELAKGDVIAFYYDESLLAIKPLQPQCVADEELYSVWYKPAGLLSQGNEFGDHCSLLRQVELAFEPRREAILVHRLDQPATGLMLVAHRGDVAAKLSQMFADRAVYKRYAARVSGAVGSPGEMRVLDQPLDGKSALSRVHVIAEEAGEQRVDVEIETGRRHQIRRHLAACGAAIVGDKDYGGKPWPMLCLTSVELALSCPVDGREKRWLVGEDEIEWAGCQVLTD